MPGNMPRPVNAKWAPRRLSFFYAGFVLVAAVLLIRLVNLGLVHGEHYARLSENNFLLTRRVDAPRGTIHDRHGNDLAYNRATFAVSMSPGNLTTETIHASLDRLGRLLGRDFGEHYRSVVRLRPRWRNYLFPRRLTLDEATAVLEQRYNLPGVAIEPRFQRYYPQGSTLCHILGYVGKIPPRHLQRYKRAGYDMNDDVGIIGLEAAFEDALRGQQGLEQVWKTGRGRILRSTALERPVPGDRLYLTIDVERQKLAEALLLGQEGVILAIDPRNGEMLAWASAPGYDLNSPGLIDNPSSKPLINRAIQEYYRPGSTFKLITALAAIEKGWDPSHRVTCERRYYLPKWKRPYTCLGWHGSIDLPRAIKYSCNVHFYEMADYLWRLDSDRAGYGFVLSAEHYGFKSATGLIVHETMSHAPGFKEGTGRLPTLSELRRERGALLHLAIGQGRVDVTPLQMLMAYVAFANGGKLLVPRLVREVRTEHDEIDFTSARLPPRSPIEISPDSREAILKGLLAAVNERGGTAYSAGFSPEWRVAGKTSTAEHGGDFEPDAWFIGFAPAEAPELCVLVLLEHGGHGGKVAAPLAVKLFAHHFEQRRGQTDVASR